MSVLSDCGVFAAVDEVLGGGGKRGMLRDSGVDENARSPPPPPPAESKEETKRSGEK